MSSFNAVTIEIKAVAEGVTGVFSRINADVRRFNRSVEHGNAALERFAEIVAVFAGVEQLRRSVEAAEQVEAATARLQSGLEASGQAASGVSAALVDLAEKEESLTGIHRDQILALQTTLISLHATVDQTRRLVPIILDYSQAFGQGPVQLAKSLGQIIQGDTAALRSFGLTAKDAPKDFEGLIALLKTGASGTAEAAFRALGPMEQFRLALYQLQLSVGEIFTRLTPDLFTNLSDSIERAAGWLERFPEVHPEWAQFVRDLLTNFSRLILPVAAVLSGVLAFRGTVKVFEVLAGAIRTVGFTAISTAAELATISPILGAISSAALVVGAAFTGWELGRFLGQLKVAGLTVDQWTQRMYFAIAAMWDKAVAYTRYAWTEAKAPVSQFLNWLRVEWDEMIVYLTEKWNASPLRRLHVFDTAAMKADLAAARQAFEAEVIQGDRGAKTTLQERLAEIDVWKKQVDALVAKPAASGSAAAAPALISRATGGLNAEQQKALADAAALSLKIHRAFLESTGRQRQLLAEDYRLAVETLRAKIADDQQYEIAKYELHQTYLAKLGDLDRKDQDARNELALANAQFRARQVENDPDRTALEKKTALVAALRAENTLIAQNLALQTQRVNDPALSPEEQISAKKRYNELLGQQAALELQITETMRAGTLAGETREQFMALRNGVENTSKDLAAVALSPFQGLKTGMANALDALLEKGTSFKTFVVSLGQDMYRAFAQSTANMVADWVVKQALMTAQFVAHTVLRTAVHAGGEEAQTAATAASAGQRGVLRLAETVWHGLLVGVQVAAHAAGEVAKTAITVAQSVTRAMKYLVEAAIAAMAGNAGIPIVGVALGLAAAGAIVAAGLALMGEFSEGGYTGNGPVGAVAGVVHRGEYVIPAARVNASTLPLLQAIHTGALADLAAPNAPNLPSAGAGGATAAALPPISNKFVFVEDRKAAAVEVLNSAAGEKAVVIHMSKPGNKQRVGIRT